MARKSKPTAGKRIEAHALINPEDPQARGQVFVASTTSGPQRGPTWFFWSPRLPAHSRTAMRESSASLAAGCGHEERCPDPKGNQHPPQSDRLSPPCLVRSSSAASISRAPESP